MSLHVDLSQMQRVWRRDSRYHGNRLAPNPYAFDALVLGFPPDGKPHNGPSNPTAPATVGPSV